MAKMGSAHLCITEAILQVMTVISSEKDCC